MSFADRNSMMILASLAIVAGLLLVITGHSTDGSNFLTVLYTIIAAAAGGHLATPYPGTVNVPNVVPSTPTATLGATLPYVVPPTPAEPQP